jgi:hypothetical protein
MYDSPPQLSCRRISTIDLFAVQAGERKIATEIPLVTKARGISC